jgi:hypothetical protein
MSGLIWYIVYSSYTLDSLLVLYSTLVWSKLSYASVVWNSITSTHSTKLERKFEVLCYTKFFNGISNFKYDDILVRLHLFSLCVRRRHLDAVFFINAFKGNIAYPSILHSVSLRIPSRTILHLLLIVI